MIIPSEQEIREMEWVDVKIAAIVVAGMMITAAIVFGATAWLIHLENKGVL